MATEEASATGAAATQRLLKYWAFGPGAAEIQPGTPGSFRRCQVELGKHIQGRQLDGFCARVIHEATGEWPISQDRGGKDGD